MKGVPPEVFASAPATPTLVSLYLEVLGGEKTPVSYQ